MRAVFIVLLAVVALACLATSVTGEQRGLNYSRIDFFLDAACTQPDGTSNITLPSSSKCVAEPPHGGYNVSMIFQCNTANNQTDLKLDLYNATAACNRAPLLTLQSSAPAKTCAPIIGTLEGMRVRLYGYIQCEDDSSSTSVVEAVMERMRRLTNGAKIEEAAAVGPMADLWALKRKLRTPQLFE